MLRFNRLHLPDTADASRRSNECRLGTFGRFRQVVANSKHPGTGSQRLTPYNEYRAVLHAHAEDSAHTGGTRAELLRAAKITGTEIVMLTDHVRPPRDFIDDSWRGIRDGVLFIPGAEAEGFLAYPERSIKTEKFSSPSEFAAIVLRTGGNIFLSHVEERPDFSTEGLDGLEIYNHHTDLKDEGAFLRWLRDALTDPVRLRESRARTPRLSARNSLLSLRTIPQIFSPSGTRISCCGH